MRGTVQVVRFATVAIGIILVLGACSSGASPTGAQPTATGAQSTAAVSPSPAAGPVTITALFMTQAGYTDDQVKAMTDTFTAANPNIKVDLQFVSYEALHDKIVTDQIGGSGQYDIVLQDAIWGPEFAVAGISSDVTASIPADMASGVFNGVLVGSQYQGKYYSIPWINDTQYLYYNKTMLQKAGFSSPPSTWDEMEQQALAMKQKGVIQYPFVGQYKQGEALVANWTSTAGGFGMTDFVDAQGKPAFNTGGGLQALEFMKKLLDEGVTNPASTNYVSNDVKGALLSGQAAFGVVWTYVYSDSLDPSKSKVVGEIGVAPMMGGGHACNGGMQLAITKNSEHRQEAIDYALYLASQPVQEEYVTAALPMWKSSFSKPELVATAPDLWAAADVAYQGMINRPMVPFYTALSNALQVALQEALLGQKTPKEALDGVAAQWSTLQSQ